MTLFFDCDSFLVGALISGIVTYLEATREKRTIKAIKNRVLFLEPYHELPKNLYYLVKDDNIISDNEVLRIYAWALLARRKRGLENDPITIAAEVIICEKLIGLTRSHALMVLANSNTLADLELRVREMITERS